MQKKAQGLSLNTMVIAAVILIVIVVITAVSYGPLQDFIKDLKEGSEGECDGTVRQSTSCPDGEEQVYKNFGKDFEGKACCRQSCEGSGTGTCVPGNECRDRHGKDLGRYTGPKDCPNGYICCS